MTIKPRHFIRYSGLSRWDMDHNIQLNLLLQQICVSIWLYRQSNHTFVVSPDTFTLIKFLVYTSTRFLPTVIYYFFSNITSVFFLWNIYYILCTYKWNILKYWWKSKWVFSFCMLSFSVFSVTLHVSKKTFFSFIIFFSLVSCRSTLFLYSNK